MEMHDETEAEIRQYPSNFDLLDEVEQLPKEYLTIVMKKLIHEWETTPYDTKMETFRAWNLISFLYFVLGDVKSALEYNSKVLQQCTDNLVGLCNKAWFLFKTQEFFKSKSVVSILKENSTNKANTLIAKAEKAFCYTRFGMKLYEKSRQLFKEVLEECAEMQAINANDICKSSKTSASKLKDIPADSICIWTFGYALTFKRMLNICNVHDPSLIDLSRQKYVTVCELHSRIINMDGEGFSLNRYKARSYVEIGQLAYEVRKNKDRFPNGIKNILPEHDDLWKPTKTYFTTALELCPNDVFVLERSGRYFRYITETKTSIKHLEKAICLRESAFSHHHLALSLKRDIEIKNVPYRSDDKRRASRNLFANYRKQRGSVHFHASRQRHMPTDASNKMTPGVSASLERTKKQHEQNYNPERTHVKETFSQTSDLEQSSSGFDLTRFDSDNDQTTKKYTKTVKKAVSSRLDTDLCGSLQQMSLDSAYGSSCNSTASQQEYLTNSRPLHQSTETENNIKDMHVQRGGRISSIKQNPESKRERSRTEQSTRNFTATPRSAVVDMIKSPQKPNFIDKLAEKDTVEKIMFHLDRSIELANNCGAIYDKGILYRQLGQTRQALETFKTLIRNKGGYCSLMQLSNGFEQAGLCLYNILCDSKEELEDSANLEYDMRVYFKKSIEVSCNLVSKIPYLKHSWVSAPTLFNFLSGKAKTKENLKDLSYLYTKLENYGAAITVLNEWKRLTNDDDEKAKIYLELVKNHMSKGNYDDAVLALDMIMCLPNAKPIVDERLYLTVHIDGGFDALKQEDFEMARLRLRNALDFARCDEDIGKVEHEGNDTDSEETNYDVFILCNTETEDNVTHLSFALRELGLRATFNYQDIMGGTLKMSGLCALIKHSSHILVVCDVEPLSKKVLHTFEMVQEILLEKGHGHTVVLTTTPDIMVPKILSKYPKINMGLNIDLDKDVKCCENKTLMVNLRELLFKLASGKQTV